MTKPLSHSSAQLLAKCEQKYVHHKVLGTKADSDYVDGDHFAIGKAVHQVLELGKHEKPDDLVGMVEACYTDPEIELDPQYKCLVMALCLKYYRLQSLKPMKLIRAEYEIKTPSVIGYIDAIMKDEHGKWWIVDIKTWGRAPRDEQIEMLRKDPQLMLYASFYKELARSLKLVMKDFGGCRLRAITKSKVQRLVDETESAFIMRLLDGGKGAKGRRTYPIEAYDIEVPFVKEDLDERQRLHEDSWVKAVQLQEGRAPKKNYASCFDYFSVCKFYSKCHGQEMSKQDKLKRFIV